MYNKFFKRILDIVFSFLVLVLLGWFLILIAALIKIDSRGPALFRQQRVGKRKKYFKILKFRSMSTDTPADTPTHLLQQSGNHITRLGKFLRKTSIDELPQMLNIFVGQMSIIGPRPALWNQDDLVAERDKYGANNIRPGLTGYAQVSGRDELPIPVKAKRDGYYVQNLSFVLDVKIFFKTLVDVFRGSGVVEGVQDDNSAKAKKS